MRHRSGVVRQWQVSQTTGSVFTSNIFRSPFRLFIAAGADDSDILEDKVLVTPKA